MLRFTVALLLLSTPTLADDAALKSLFHGGGPKVVLGDTGTPDIHGAPFSGTLGVSDEADDLAYDPLLPDWMNACGEGDTYSDSRCDPASPDYVSPYIYSPDYDPEGRDKYMDGIPQPGDPDWNSYVKFAMTYLQDAYRPEGMTDSDFVVWIEDGCPSEPDASRCGFPSP